MSTTKRTKKSALTVPIDGKLPRITTFESIQSLAQNAVAIADAFYADRKAEQRFYAAHSSQLNGFPGIWNWVANAAILFTEAETPGCWEKGGWIEATGLYAKFLLEKGNEITLPTDDTLEAYAADLIRRAPTL